MRCGPCRYSLSGRWCMPCPSRDTLSTLGLTLTYYNMPPVKNQKRTPPTKIHQTGFHWPQAPQGPVGHQGMLDAQIGTAGLPGTLRTDNVRCWSTATGGTSNPRSSTKFSSWPRSNAKQSSMEYCMNCLYFITITTKKNNALKK